MKGCDALLQKLKDYTPTRFMAKDSTYDKDAADFAVSFIECLCHTKGTWAGKPFDLIDWQEKIIRDIFGILKPDGYRQFNTAYVEIPKKQGKSELAAAIALLLAVPMVKNVQRFMAVQLIGNKLQLFLTLLLIWYV